jgi:thiol:disulfide interchange protein
MMKLKFAILTLCLALSQGRQQSATTEASNTTASESGDKVKSVDVKYFDENVVDAETNQVKEGNPWFLQFHASWCIHCKEAAEVWADFHAKHAAEVNIAKVDCTNED